MEAARQQRGDGSSAAVAVAAAASWWTYHNIKLVVYCCYWLLLGSDIGQHHGVSQLCVSMSFGAQRFLFPFILAILGVAGIAQRTYICRNCFQIFFGERLLLTGEYLICWVFLSLIRRYIQPIIPILWTDRIVVTKSMFSIGKLTNFA